MPADSFGITADGRSVDQIVLGKEPGLVLRILTLGATVHRLEVIGGDGSRRNVVLGHETPDDYLASTDYIGGTIGRYANRIASGRLTIDGREHTIGAHDRGNHLHGGPDGFDRRIWEVVEVGRRHAVLRIESPDGDQGFPGTLVAQVRFEVGEETVRIGFAAVTDATTVVNLTSHAYFNLEGDGAGTVDRHELTVAASAYTPVDATGIPLGEHLSVEGTPFDFRRAQRVGLAVRHDNDQIVLMRGIDHNFVLDGVGWRTAAVLESRHARTRMDLRTDQPGLQVYTGNYLDGTRRTGSGLYRQGDGIALEPQLFPDSPNRPSWPSALLRPGQRYRSTLEWRFSALAPD